MFLLLSSLALASTPHTLAHPVYSTHESPYGAPVLPHFIYVREAYSEHTVDSGDTGAASVVSQENPLTVVAGLVVVGAVALSMLALGLIVRDGGTIKS